jgi:lambda repressor-like predicted transcriptional regulator
MYRDVAQWSGIRDQVLRKGISIRQVVRETGISGKTVRKMLDLLLPERTKGTILPLQPPGIRGMSD